MRALGIAFVAVLLLALGADAFTLRQKSKRADARARSSTRVSSRAQAQVREKVRSQIELNSDMELAEAHTYILDSYAHLKVAVKMLLHFVSQNGTSNHTANVSVVKSNASAPVAKGNASVHVIKSNASVPVAKGNNSAHSKVGNATKVVAAKPEDAKAKLKTEETVLKGLVQHLKGNIGKFKKADDSGKAETTRIVERLEKRLADDKARLNNTELSDVQHEMLVNRTRVEEREMSYWKKERSIQHDMLHANLRMTHGLMSRVGTVLDAYMNVMKNGHLDANMKNKLQMVANALPKALIETRDELDKHAFLQTEHIRYRLDRRGEQ